MKNSVMILFIFLISFSSLAQDGRYSILGYFDYNKLEPRNIIFNHVETKIRIYDNVKDNFVLEVLNVKLSCGTIRQDSTPYRRTGYTIYINRKRVGSHVNLIILDSSGNDTVTLTILDIPTPQVYLKDYGNYPVPPWIEEIGINNGSILGLRPASINCDYKIISFEVEIYSPEMMFVHREKIKGNKFSANVVRLYYNCHGGARIKVKNVIVKASNGQTYVCENVFLSFRPTN